MFKKVREFFYYLFKSKIILPKNYCSELEEAINLISRKFELDNSNFRFSSKKSFNIFEGKGSSIGRLKYKNKVIIYIKPQELQGNLSYGKQNELILINTINSYSSSLNINFITSISSSYSLNGVTRADNLSQKENQRYFKSDIQLLGNEGVLCNISLKKEGGFIWESIVKRYNPIYNKFIFKGLNGYIENLQFVEVEKFPGKYIMLNSINNKPYGRIIIRDFPFYEDENIIFGNEVPKPIIIEKTFSEKDFTYNNNTLDIQVKYLYKELNEIEEANKLPVLTFSRNMSKPYGIDFKCIPENKTHFTYKANVLELPYKVLMDD